MLRIIENGIKEFYFITQPTSLRGGFFRVLQWLATVLQCTPASRAVVVFIRIRYTISLYLCGIIVFRLSLNFSYIEFLLQSGDRAVAATVAQLSCNEQVGFSVYYSIKREAIQVGKKYFLLEIKAGVIGYSITEVEIKREESTPQYIGAYTTNLNKIRKRNNFEARHCENTIGIIKRDDGYSNYARHYGFFNTEEEAINSFVKNKLFKNFISFKQKQANEFKVQFMDSLREISSLLKLKKELKTKKQK